MIFKLVTLFKKLNPEKERRRERERETERERSGREAERQRSLLIPGPVAGFISAF